MRGERLRLVVEGALVWVKTNTVDRGTHPVVWTTRMRWRLTRWCVLGALGCGIASPASAQALSPAVAARVEKLRNEFRALYQKSDPEAIERIRAAWKLSNDYVDLCNLAKTQFDLGRERDAAATLLRCLKMIPPPEVDRELADFRRAAERYMKLARAMLGVVEIEGNVAGAEVLVDGELVGVLPLEDPIFVDPGLRTVEVRAPGFTSDSKKVDARAGTSVRLKMQLAQLKPEVLAGSMSKGAPVAGEKAPLPPKAAAKGSPWMSAAAPKEEPSLRTRPLVTGIALTMFGTGVGIGGFVAAELADAEADTVERVLDAMGRGVPCSDAENWQFCEEYARGRGQTAPLTLLGVSGLAAAGVGGALIIYELVRASSQATKDSPRTAVLVTLRGSALTVTGSF